MSEKKSTAALDALATLRKRKQLKEEKEEKEVETSASSTFESGNKSNIPTHHRHPGRPKIDKSKKRIQITLTIAPATYQKLSEWAESLPMPKSAQRTISEYFDYHIDDFINSYNKK